VSYAVDTDIASAILKGQLPCSYHRRLVGQQLAITFVTVGELTQWTHLHRWGASRRAGLRAFFASVVVLPCSSRPPRSGARSRLTAPAPRASRPVNDSWIAACCIAHEVPLATFNIKDYADFVEHEVLELVH
jgi:toxin FitB